MRQSGEVSLWRSHLSRNLRGLKEQAMQIVAGAGILGGGHSQCKCPETVCLAGLTNRKEARGEQGAE